MLTTGALFFFCLTLIAKVEVRSSVTHIIIACRPDGTVATEMPSVATRFSPSIFLSHVTLPPKFILALFHYLSTLLSRGRIKVWIGKSITICIHGLLVIFCIGLPQSQQRWQQ